MRVLIAIWTVGTLLTIAGIAVFYPYMKPIPPVPMPDLKGRLEFTAHCMVDHYVVACRDVDLTVAAPTILDGVLTEWKIRPVNSATPNTYTPKAHDRHQSGAYSPARSAK